MHIFGKFKRKEGVPAQSKLAHLREPNEVRVEQDLIDDKVVEVDDIGVDEANEVCEIGEFNVRDGDVFHGEVLRDQVELEERVRTLVLLRLDLQVADIDALAVFELGVLKLHVRHVEDGFALQIHFFGVLESQDGGMRDLETRDHGQISSLSSRFCAAQS